MRRAAWIVCGGVVYLISMMTLGRWLRDINSMQDLDDALLERVDQMLIATSGVKRGRQEVIG